MRLPRLVNSACALGLVFQVTAHGQTPSPGVMTAEVVSDLLALSKQYPSSMFAPLTKTMGRSTALTVVSNRLMIAYTAASTQEKGGRYTPPETARFDLVLVSCGDADIGEVFECEKVSVVDPFGQTVQPVTTQSGPKEYKNAAGGAWTVREASAFYDRRTLMRGFTAVAYGFDGTEWPLEVSPEEASSHLMIGDPLPSYQMAVTGGPPPTQLRVTVRLDGDRWRVSTLNQNFTWRNCAAYIGASSARVPTLEYGGTAFISRSEFSPPIGAVPTLPSITCKVGTLTFTATDSPTPR